MSGDNLPPCRGGAPCRYTESRPNVFMLVHVVSASPTSTDIREVLIRICRELKARFPSIEWDLEENEDYQQVKDAFFKTLERAGESALVEKTFILLIIDAINQLNPFYNAQTMDWFPTYLYVCVCSANGVYLPPCCVPFASVVNDHCNV